MLIEKNVLIDLYEKLKTNKLINCHRKVSMSVFFFLIKGNARRQDEDMVQEIFRMYRPCRAFIVPRGARSCGLVVCHLWQIKHHMHMDMVRDKMQQRQP